MNPPPLPEPHQFTCARCGFGWDEPSGFCPRCGAALAKDDPIKYGRRTLIQVALGVACASVGALGACVASISIFGGAWYLVGGGALLALAGYLYWVALRYGK